MTRRILSTCALLMFAAPAALQAQDVQVTLDPDRASAWTVDENIFGKFHEHNGRDAYPGLFAQHFANSSFETWCTFGSPFGQRCRTDPDKEEWRTRTAELFRNRPGQTGTYEGLSYPWEPFNGNDQVGDPNTDGPRGQAAFSTVSEGQTDGTVPHDERFQRVQLEAGEEDGLQQRVALPDFREDTYEVDVTLRGTVDEVTIYFEGPAGYTYDQQTLDVTSDWQRRTVQLTSDAPFVPGDYRDSPSPLYLVSLVASGPGRLDLDRATLFPADAARGQFNPSTIDLLQKHNVTSLRWPGGNWASAYQWQDGVGPVEERPVRWNIAWGGLEHNYLGTDEFLEFAGEAGVEPYLNVGFNMTADQPLRITPEEAAGWVEYTNTRSDVPDVEHWQIGNEDYGDYQVGSTNPCDYADGVREMALAMKDVDPTITVIAAGIDPLYNDYEGYTAGCGYWQGNDWNRILVERAGDAIDGIDIHRYVNGVQNDEALRNNWEKNEYLQTIVAFPTQFQDIIEILRQTAENQGHPDLLVTVGEWNLGPANAGAAGWPLPNYPKMAHAAFVGGMLNTFIREGDAVRYSYQRDNILYYRPYPIDFRPINPGNFALKSYAAPFENSDTDWHHLEPVTNGPTFFARGAGNRQQDTEEVPYVDVTSIVSEAKDRIVVYAVNRDLQSSHTAAFELAGGWQADGSVEVVEQFSRGGPFQAESRTTNWMQWMQPNDFTVDNSTEQPGPDGRVQLDMPPASIARLTYQVSEGDEPPTADTQLGGPYETDDHTVALLHFDGTFDNESTRAPDGMPSDSVTSGTPNGEQASFFDGEVPGDSFGQSLHLDNKFTGTPSDCTTDAECEYVTLADDDDLDLTGDWTVEAWVRGTPYDDGNQPHFFYKAESAEEPTLTNYFANTQLGAGLDQDVRAGYRLDDGGFQNTTTPSNTATEGDWYHYAFVRDTERGHIALIVRDTNRDVVATSSAPLGGTPLTTNGALYVGVHPFNGSKHTEGEIDEVRVSDVVRTSLYRDTGLPTELVAFEGTADGAGAVRLSWRTASETGNARFEVQHRRFSSSAVAEEDAWAKIGQRQGAGTTAEAQAYTFRATDLAPGTHAFRLRQVDRDGTATLSQVVRVEVGMAERARLAAPYPNPARSGAGATVSFAVKEQAPVTVTLYDALGRQVRTLFEGTPEAGGQMQQVRIETGSLSSGVYLVRLEGAGGVRETETLTIVQ